MADKIRDPGWACVQIVHRFFRGLDENRVEAAVALFTDDGIWFRRGEPLKGRAAILAALNERPANRVTRHLITNAVADEVGESMTVRYDVTIYSHDGAVEGVPPLAPPHTLLSCEDQLVDTAEGWRFASRRSQVVFASR